MKNKCCKVKDECGRKGKGREELGKTNKEWEVRNKDGKG